MLRPAKQVRPDGGGGEGEGAAEDAIRDVDGTTVDISGEGEGATKDAIRDVDDTADDIFAELEGATTKSADRDGDIGAAAKDPMKLQLIDEQTNKFGYLTGSDWRDASSETVTPWYVLSVEPIAVS